MKDNEKAKRGYKTARVHAGKSVPKERQVKRIPTDSFPFMAYVEDLSVNGTESKPFHRVMPPAEGQFNDVAVFFTGLTGSPAFLQAYVNGEVFLEIPVQLGVNKLPDIPFKGFARIDFALSATQQIRGDDDPEPNGDAFAIATGIYVAGIYFTRAAHRNPEMPAPTPRDNPGQGQGQPS